MATSKPSCDPCLRKKTSPVIATKYCNDCDKNLCVDCVNAHSLFKALSSHHLVESGSLPIDLVSVKKSCAKHENMMLDFFCVEHDFLCCHSCLEETHRTCQNFFSVDGASKGIRKSYMLEDLFDTVSNIRGTLEKLLSNRDENLKCLNDEEADVLRHFSGIKSSIMEHLENLERKIISDVKCLKEKCEIQIKSDKERLSKMIEFLDENTSKLNSASKYGSENQLFFLLNSCKSKMLDYNITMQEIISSISNAKISFKPPEPQQLVTESIWSVHIESTCPIKYEASKLKQAQVLPKPISIPTKFEIVSKFDIKFTSSDWISSIAVTDDNRLLLCNRKSSKLLVYSNHGEYLQDCALAGGPWDIAIILGDDKAVVSLPDQCSIQFVDIQLMKSGSTHSVPGFCRGIAVVDDTICVGGYGEIYILSKQGKHTKTINIPSCSKIYYLHPGPQDSVYYTAYDNNKVGCVKLSGKVCFTCTLDNFSGPEAVTTDKGGNLYVVCMNLANMNRLSLDLHVIDSILIDEKKLCNPYGVAFSKNYRNLFVTNNDGKSVVIFSCS